MTTSASTSVADEPAQHHRTTEVLIVGAGPSGLAVAALLQKGGFDDILILEAADDLGGTWRDNTYPGCGCDIPAPLYSFSFAQNPDWTRLFAGQPELLAYFRRFAEQQRLTEKIAYDRRVDVATWDAAAAEWLVTTEIGDAYRCRYLIVATGVLHHPELPDIPGIERFAGERFHSAEWNHAVDLRGKRIAVVGTGASAIQFVPEIVDDAGHVTVFQRTAPWIVPKGDRLLTERHRWLCRWIPPYRWWVRAQLFRAHERRAKGFVKNPEKMAESRRLALDLMRRQISDDELRQQVTPTYTIGCKRLLISSKWYRTLGRDDVSLKPVGVGEVRAHTVVGSDGTEVPTDVIIFGTGFDTQNTVRFDILGEGGRRLSEAWADGKRAYYGTAIAGFPNLFTLLGPNSGLGHNSQLFMIETQSRYIVRLLRRSRKRGIGAVKIKDAAQERFNDWVDDEMKSTVWHTGGCQSWHTDSASGRNTVLWPATAVAYWWRMRRSRMDDYDVEPCVSLRTMPDQVPVSSKTWVARFGRQPSHLRHDHRFGA